MSYYIADYIMLEQFKQGGRMKKEVYKGWRYPCTGRMFEWDVGMLCFSIGIFTTIFKKKADLPEHCPCGKNCKPVRVRITVEAEK